MPQVRLADDLVLSAIVTNVSTAYDWASVLFASYYYDRSRLGQRHSCLVLEPSSAWTLSLVALTTGRAPISPLVEQSMHQLAVMSKVASDMRSLSHI